MFKYMLSLVFQMNLVFRECFSCYLFCYKFLNYCGYKYGYKNEVI